MRNIFSSKELATTFKFLKIVVILKNVLNTHEEFSNCFDEDFSTFVKVKNNPGFEISKLTLQIYVFVYQKLMDFPSGQFDFDALTTQNLFESVHRVVNVKIHLHQSHVTGKVLGYGQDFCNMKVRENQNQFTCIAHHFFGFVMFFLLEGIRFLVWGTRHIYWWKWTDKH